MQRAAEFVYMYAEARVLSAAVAESDVELSTDRPNEAGTNLPMAGDCRCANAVSAAPLRVLPAFGDLARTVSS
jgi:hypothetical protein